MSSVALSDTNVLLRLIQLQAINLHGLQLPTYGVLKFHPIVIEEIEDWVKKHRERGRHKKVDKFSLATIQAALSIARKNVQIVTTPTEAIKSKSFAQYRAIGQTINSNSSPPTDKDLMLLYHAEVNDHYMVCNDDIVYKIGKRVILHKSLTLEDLIIDLGLNGVITKEQIQTFSDDLGRLDEPFNLTYVMLRLP